jgi:hypothetical protein
MHSVVQPRLVVLNSMSTIKVLRLIGMWGVPMDQALFLKAKQCYWIGG